MNTIADQHQQQLGTVILTEHSTDVATRRCRRPRHTWLLIQSVHRWDTRWGLLEYSWRIVEEWDGNNLCWYCLQLSGQSFSTSGNHQLSLSPYLSSNITSSQSRWLARAMWSRGILTIKLTIKFPSLVEISIGYIQMLPDFAFPFFNIVRPFTLQQFDFHESNLVTPLEDLSSS